MTLDDVYRPRRAGTKAGMCCPLKLGGVCNVTVRKLYQNSKVINVVAKYGKQGAAGVEIRAGW